MVWGGFWVGFRSSGIYHMPAVRTQCTNIATATPMHTAPAHNAVSCGTTTDHLSDTSPPLPNDAKARDTGSAVL